MWGVIGDGAPLMGGGLIDDVMKLILMLIVIVGWNWIA